MESMEEKLEVKKNPYEYLHAVRALATVLVVLIHIRTGEYRFPLDSEWGHFISLFCNVAVPLFVMITGALFLTRPKPFDKVKHAKRVIHLIWTTILWCFIYNLLSITLIEHSFGAGTIVRSLVMAMTGDTTYAYQLWYMYMIIGLYIILPVIRKYMEDCSRKEMKVWLLLLFFFGLVMETVKVVWRIDEPIWENSFRYFEGFLVYVVLGAYLHKYEIARWVKITLIVTLLLQIVFFGYMIFARNNSMHSLHTFLSPFVAELAAVIFLFNKKFGEKIMRPRWLNKCIMGLAVYSNAIYILHPMVIQALNKLLSLSTSFAPVLISSVLLTAMVTVCCLFVGWVIRKIPGLKVLL